MQHPNAQVDSTEHEVRFDNRLKLGRAVGHLIGCTLHQHVFLVDGDINNPRLYCAGIALKCLEDAKVLKLQPEPPR